MLLGAYDYQADIFSFALLLWEVMHVQLPFRKLDPRQVRLKLSYYPLITLSLPSHYPLITLS